MISEELKARMDGLIKGEILYDEPLCNHSTIKIGGRAAAFITPLNVEALVEVIKFARDNKFSTFILGAGSNVLFRDDGFDGIVVSSAKLNKFLFEHRDGSGFVVEADAGVLVSQLVNFSIQEGASGFEDLAGIPGTVGGALIMNAGTHDGSISDPLVEVNAVDKSGRFYQWPKDKVEFSYRRAKFPKSCVILSAKFLLQSGSKEDIEAKANKLRERRKERHPLSWPSLGSIFKNPRKGRSAGELIEDAGLKGVRVGGARISNEHGNWIINENNASSKDIEVLIHLVREKVKEWSDIVLEPEIVIVGRR